jgi:phosphohistidine swiveling domain-containing protein
VSSDHDAVTEPRTWLPDPSHYPEQMTRLSATVWFEAVGLGLHEAARELRAPFAGFRPRVELGWAYEGELAPEWEHDAELLRSAALELPHRWERALRPRVREITRELERLRPERPPPDAAGNELDRLWELVREQWTIHFLVVIPAQMAAELLHDRLTELAEDVGPLAAYRLLGGIQNPADDAVWALVDAARREDVADLLRDFAPAASVQRLRAIAGGRRFLRELDLYLERYGGRSRWHELSLPREVEQPVLTLEAVRLALGADKRPAPPRPPEVPAELAELHALVRPSYALKELHTYEIDYPGLLATREALLGFGRRLVSEGLLDDVDDVWMLERSELRRALTEPIDLRALVAERLSELERGRVEGLRPFLGEPPEESIRHAALEKFYGSGGRALTGAAASPGVAEGIARVVGSGADLTRLSAGDILVAVTTTPAWTPLFPSLGGLVTETGGILSHAAVVAREYGLPAVVGAAGASRAIADGARIRIDGSAGTVTLL